MKLIIPPATNRNKSTVKTKRDEASKIRHCGKQYIDSHSIIDQTTQARPKTIMGEDYNAKKRKFSRHNKFNTKYRETSKQMSNKVYIGSQLYDSSIQNTSKIEI